MATLVTQNVSPFQQHTNVYVQPFTCMYAHKKDIISTVVWFAKFYSILSVRVCVCVLPSFRFLYNFIYSC